MIVFLLVSIGLPRTGCSQDENAKTQNAVSSPAELPAKGQIENAQSLIAAGDRDLRVSNARQAIENYERALAEFRMLHARGSEATTLNKLGLSYASLSQYAKAISFFEQALAIQRDIGERLGEEITLNSLGEAYRAIGQYAKAIGFFEQALAIQRGADFARARHRL